MEIPVEFEYKGKQYKGVLSSVGGAGSKMFYLMVNNMFCGSLCWVEDNPAPHLPRDPATVKYKWRFTSQSGKLNFLEDVFIKAIKPHLAAP